MEICILMGSPHKDGNTAALLRTCGYRQEKGCDLFEEGIRRYCKRSGLRYLGYHAGPFMDKDKESRAREFAKKLLKSV